MSGKTKLNIVQNGLVAYFDASNNRSVLPSGSVYTTTGDVAFMRNISNSYEKQRNIGKTDYLVSVSTNPSYSNTDNGCLIFNRNEEDFLLFYPYAEGPNSLILNADFGFAGSTISFWINITSAPDSPQVILTLLEKNTILPYYISVAKVGVNTAYIVLIDEYSGINTPILTEFFIGQWYNFTLCSQDTAAKSFFYINSIQYGETIYGPLGQYKPNVIGTNIAYNENFLDAKLSNIMFYDRILTSQEVLQNYNALKFKFSSIGVPKP